MAVSITRRVATLSAACVLSGLLTQRPCLAEVETKTFVAYSMKAAQTRVEAAVKAGADFRKKQPDLYYLGGITKPWAVVIDSKNSDWILVGERDPKSSILTLDDWVVALRARYNHPDKDPGVTIDPHHCDECLKAGKKDGCSHFTRQDVRFFGGIENTHFGKVCYEADWLMKKIGLGLETLPVESLKSYTSLLVEQTRRTGVANTNVGSRFWFYPLVSRVNVFPDVALLDKFQMGVFTQVQYAEVDGKPVTDADSFQDYPSQGFSRSFTDNYDAAAETREVLSTLCGLTRLAALGKGVVQMKAKPSLDYYLTGYQPEVATTPADAQVLKVEDAKAGLSISGGVNLMALAVELRSGDPSALTKLAIATRPSSDAVVWAFQMETQGGRPVGIAVEDSGADPSQVGPLFAQGRFLCKQKHYDAALECYDKAAKLSPQLAESAWIAKGEAYFDAGRDEDAVRCYDTALQLNPTSTLALKFKGSTLGAMGKPQEGLACFEKALSMDSSDAHGMVGKAMILIDLNRRPEAVALLDKTLMLSSSLGYAWGFRAVALAEMGEYEQSLASFDKALADARQDRELTAECMSHKAAALAALGRYEQAVELCERTLKLDPTSLEAAIIKFAASAKLASHPVYLGFGGRLEVPDSIFGKLVSARWSHDPPTIVVSALTCMMGGQNSPRIALQAALSGLDNAVHFDPGCADAHSLRGVVLGWMGKHDEAAAAHAKALELRPDDPVFLERKAGNLYCLGRPEEALALFDRAIRLDPKSPTSWHNKGVILAQLNKPKDALKCFDKALGIYPDYTYALCAKTLALLLKDKTHEALECAELALKQDPGAAGPWFAKGMALLGAERYKEALPCFEKALEIEPGRYDAWPNRLLTLTQMGRSEEALSACNDALKENPKAPILWQTKGQILLLKGDETGAAACYKMAEELSRR